MTFQSNFRYRQCENELCCKFLKVAQALEGLKHLTVMKSSKLNVKKIHSLQKEVLSQLDSRATFVEK